MCIYIYSSPPPLAPHIPVLLAYLTQIWWSRRLVGVPYTTQDVPSQHITLLFIQPVFSPPFFSSCSRYSHKPFTAARWTRVRPLYRCSGWLMTRSRQPNCSASSSRTKKFCRCSLPCSLPRTAARVSESSLISLADAIIRAGDRSRANLGYLETKMRPDHQL